jgi:hypothetical protein
MFNKKTRRKNYGIIYIGEVKEDMKGIELNAKSREERVGSKTKESYGGADGEY